jgi:hypothetical protein
MPYCMADHEVMRFGRSVSLSLCLSVSVYVCCLSVSVCLCELRQALQATMKQTHEALQRGANEGTEAVDGRGMLREDANGCVCVCVWGGGGQPWLG